MNTKVHNRDHRKFKELIFESNKEAKIDGGSNEAGNSTLQDRATIALTGNFENFNAAEAQTILVQPRNSRCLLRLTS